MTTNEKATDRKYGTGRAKKMAVNLFLGTAIGLMLSVVFNKNATLFGYKPYFVASESMTPAYGKYALVLVKNKTYDKVDPGDVIAFKADGLGGNTALHRVVSVTPEGFITKGDANKQADRQMVNDLAFLGRTVWHTNLTTKLIPVLQTPKGIFFMAALPMAWVILVIRLIRLCAAAAVSKNAH